MKNLHAKILKVQGALKPVAKDQKNPHYGSRYFNVDSVIAELRPLLVANGLSLVQPMCTEGDANVLRTVLTDVESGESERWDFRLPEVQDPQKFGALLTYMRRYSLVSLFCLEAEDDDGNAASGIAPTAQPAYAPYKKTYYPKA